MNFIKTNLLALLLVTSKFCTNAYSFEVMQKNPAEFKTLSQPLERKNLMLISGEFDPVSEELKLAGLKKGARSFSNYGLVQFITGDNNAFENITQMGATILFYLPEDVYVVRWNSKVKNELLNSKQFRYVGDYEAEFKLSPGLWQVMKSAQKNVALPLQVELFGFKGSSLQHLKNTLIKSYPQVVFNDAKVLNGMPYVQVMLPVNQNESIFEIIQNEDVMWIGKHHQKRTFNLDSVGPIQSNETNISQASIWNKGLIGTGQIVAVTDSGLDRNQDFFSQYNTGSGTVVKKYTNATRPPLGEVGELNLDHKVVGYYLQPGATEYDNNNACGEDGAANSYHGTHVAGTVAGDSGTPASSTSANYDAGDGMAPHAQILFQDIGIDTTGCLISGDSYHDRIYQAVKSGAGISSNSYGFVLSRSDDGYQFDDFQLDLASYELEEMLLVVAAGNDGFKGVIHAGQAKNALTVGALGHGNSNVVASFSGRGPSFDGRVKPDIMAPGVNIISANGNTDNAIPPVQSSAETQALTGTSMATPTVAGGAALMRQYFMDGFYPSGVKNTSNQLKPSGALMKSVLLNGTLLRTNTPSVDQGWGRIWLDNNLYFTGDSKTLRVWDLPMSNGLKSGESMSFKVNVPAGEPFRATLTWFDPPSTFVSAKALVNDLDLEVRFNGQVYKGNELSSGVSQTGGSADTVNTVEQFHLPEPTAGVYEVIVKGTKVSGNETTANRKQGFALVTSQAQCDTAINDAPAVSLTETDAFDPLVGIQAISGVTDYQVYRKEGGCEAPNLDYKFIGQINTAMNQVSFLDEETMGGQTYGYAVKAVDACGEGTYSTCKAIQSNALCATAPTFNASTVTVSNSTGSDCSTHLKWQAGVNQCAGSGSIKYNVYRSLDAEFIPSSANKIASGITELEYNDFTVVNNESYFYMVTAVDNLGNESTSHSIVSVFTSGDQFTAGDYSDDPDNESFALLDSPWQVYTFRGSTGTKSFHNAEPYTKYTPNTCAFITLPELEIQQGQSSLSYDVAYNLEEFWDGVVVQISTNGGETWFDLPPDGGYPSDFSATAPQGQPINECGFLPTQGAFNGSQNTFVSYNTDLSSFAGQKVIVRWGFSSDGSAEEDGMYLDNISINNASSPGVCLARTINKNTSGPWYNPAEDGHGFFMEVSPGVNNSPDKLTSYWYTYLDGEPRWVFGTGSIESNTVTLDMLTTDGPQAPPNFDPNDLNLIQWGSLTFDFQNQFNANISWDSLINGFDSGEMPITKIANLSDSPKSCLSGSYSNPNESGHGFVVEVLGSVDAESVLVSWYSYDNEGNQIWLLGQGILEGMAASFPVNVFSGADFSPDFNPNEVSGQQWGTLNLEFSVDNTLNVSWIADLPGYVSGQIETNKFTQIKGKGCL